MKFNKNGVIICTMSKEKEIARKTAEITLKRVKKYEELDAPTSEERERESSGKKH